MRLYGDYRPESWESQACDSTSDNGTGPKTGAVVGCAVPRGSGLAHGELGLLALGRVIGRTGGVLAGLLGIALLEDILRDLELLVLIGAVVLLDVGVQL